MLKVFLVVLVVIVAIPLIFAATKPARFQVKRQATVNAPPEKIFPLINDFHKWGAWSPWEKLDPNLKRTYSGAESGKGAAYAWEGNKRVGKGRMEITESTPYSRVVLDLHFIAPWEARNVTTFELAPSGGSTSVSWTMDGPATFMTKLMTVFVSMDAMVGKDFEAGLANLKAATE
jgi:hypothetical protein